MPDIIREQNDGQQTEPVQFNAPLINNQADYGDTPTLPITFQGAQLVNNQNQPIVAATMSQSSPPGGIPPYAIQYTNIGLVRELNGSGELHFSPDKIKGHRIYLVPWFNQCAALNALLGYVSVDKNGFPTVYLPDIFSYAYPFLFCQDVKVKGECIRGVDYLSSQWAPRIWYNYAKITAEYMPLDYDIHFKIGGKIIKLKNTDYTFCGYDIRPYFANDTKPSPVVTLSDSIGRIVPHGELNITRKQMLSNTFGLITQMLGTVSSTNFFGFRPTTLQFSGIDAKRHHMANGTPCFKCDFKFAFDPNSFLCLYNTKKDLGPPGFQWVKNINYDGTQPPSLTWQDGNPLGLAQNALGAVVQDAGFIYALSDFNLLTMFI